MKSQQTSQLTPLQQAALSRKLLEAEILAKAWADTTFRDRLETDPASALTEAGFPLPRGRTVRVIFEEPGTTLLVLAKEPAPEEEVCDEELAGVAGGSAKAANTCNLQEVLNSRERNFMMIEFRGFDEFSPPMRGAKGGSSWDWE